MRHKRGNKILNMPSDQRIAVLRNLMISLIKCGKIETTIAKAKYLSSNIEKLITKGKEKNLSNTRYLSSIIGHDNVNALYEISQKFFNRNGGYTRVVKTWVRYGDASKTAIVEFVA